MLAAAPTRSSSLHGYLVLGAWGLDGDCGCGCGGSCGGGLGAITADQAAQQAMPKSAIRNTPGFTHQVFNNIVNAASSGVFNDYNAQNCPSMGPSGSGAAYLSLASTGSGLALTTAIQTGMIAAGPATLGISIAIAGITALFGTIFNHHAAAVAKEQRVLCASGPAANNYLQVIDQAVRQGLATPAQAVQALKSLLSDYTATVSPILKNNSSQCNAACVELKELTAIVAMRSSQYQDLAAQQAAAAAAPKATSGGSGPTTAPAVASGSTLQIPTVAAAASSTPSWLPIAALAFLGFLVVKVL